MSIRRIIIRTKIRRILHSRTRLHEIHRKAQWLEFENESILQFLAKYKIVNGRQESASGIPPDKKIHDYVDIKNQPGIIVDAIEL